MKKVLVVEDDASILEVMRYILQDAGYSTQTLSDGGKAYEKVTQYKPDIILLDISLSGYDGRLICRDLKNAVTTKNIPIIMIAAHTEVRKESVKCGADDFLAKPFNIDDLLKKIKQYSNN